MCLCCRIRRIREWSVGFAIFVSVFLLYAVTAAPGVTFHDSGELITGAVTLGIPHPPGSPTWCLLGHVFSGLPVGSPAHRINLMSGFFAAATCVVVFLLVRRIVTNVRDCSGHDMPWWSEIGPVLGALALAQAPGFWEKAVQAEIYTLNAFFLAACIYTYVLWVDSYDSGGKSAHLYVLSFLLALGIGNYLAMVYFVPVFALLVVAGKRGMWRNAEVLLKCALILSLTTIAVYMYLPIRSAANPPIDWENPETLTGFMSALQRTRWGAFNWNQQSWQFVLEWLGQYDFIRQFGLCGLLLAAGGALLMARRCSRVAVLLALCFFVYAFLMLLMQASTTVLYRSSAYAETYGLQEFHIPLYLIVAVAMGAGSGYLVRYLAERRPWMGWMAGGMVGVLVLSRMAANYEQCDYSGFVQPREFGKRVLRGVPAGSWVFPGSDNFSFILIYLKFCESERPDVHILTPTGNYLDAVSVRGATNTLSGEIMRREYLADPGLYRDSILNQEDDRSVHGDVFFSNIPDDYPGIARNLFPTGMLFRVSDGSDYDPEGQRRFWTSLLSEPVFSVEHCRKHDFLEHMSFMLYVHALAHFRRAEYSMSDFLLAAAMRYSVRGRVEVYSLAGRCRLELGDVEGALNLSRKALGINEKDTMAWTTMGCAFGRIGKHDMALKCFESVLLADPGNAEAAENVRRAKEKTGIGAR